MFISITNINKLSCQKNSLSENALSDNHLDWLDRLHKSMLVGSYADDSIHNYLMEVRLLFQFHFIQQFEILFYLRKAFRKLSEQGIDDEILEIYKAESTKIKILFRNGVSGLWAFR